MNGLYEITGLQHKEGAVTATYTLDPSHHIFKGHYPGQPVLPGACILQMVKDTLERALDKKLILKQASPMKFLTMVNPLENNQLTISLIVNPVDDVLKVSGSLTAGDNPCFKFQGSFALLSA